MLLLTKARSSVFPTTEKQNKQKQTSKQNKKNQKLHYLVYTMVYSNYTYSIYTFLHCFIIQMSNIF